MTVRLLGRPRPRGTPGPARSAVSAWGASSPPGPRAATRWSRRDSAAGVWVRLWVARAVQGKAGAAGYVRVRPGLPIAPRCPCVGTARDSRPPGARFLVGYRHGWDWGGARD